MTAKAPPVPNRPFRFSLGQYLEMGNRGYFDHARVELIHGEIVEMSPMNWPHHICVGLVTDALAAAFPADHFVDVQQVFPIPNSPLGSAPQPDVAVVPGARRDYADHPTAAVLIVEVSHSTLTFDLRTKAELYATANVPEYWVLDVEGRELHVFRDPHPLPLPQDLATTAYATHLTFGPDAAVSPLAATVRVADLLP